MGKFLNKLNKIGKKTWSALNSSTAKKVYSTIGKAVEAVASSEIGSAAIDGVIQGTVQAAITGESYGESIKQAVLLNVLGKADSLPDPLSVGEQALAKKVKELEEHEKNEQVYNMYSEQILNTFGRELEDVRKFALGTLKEEDKMENQIQILSSAIDGYGKILGHEINGLERLSMALQKETLARTADERKMVKEYREKIDALAQAVETEREGIQEEAFQEMITMSTDVLEAAAEEVPIFGSAAAAAIATGRAIEGGLKLKKVIESLTGINLSHMSTPKIQPETVRVLAIKDSPEDIEDKELVLGVKQKLRVIKENAAEIQHIKQEIYPRIVKAAKEDHKILGHKSEKMLHPLTITKFSIPQNEHPQIHVYSAPWDSDEVFMFHCIPPHHQEESFFLGFDLELEYVMYVDLTVRKHKLNREVQEVTGVDFKTAYSDFLNLAADVEGASFIHRKRLLRSRVNHPIYLGPRDYEVDFETLRTNALELVFDEELQMHVLRGPLHFQRRAIMASLRYGVEVMNQKFDRDLFLKYA
ncbi:VP5 [Eubenangee virus]|uniref:Outer capsid protein VP5 n=1 Tax=Eubenangee virus TaxID=40056 RepID=H9ZXR7_9REOV|nr:VP5 [Eubenangee virus]AFH41514.1 VP5 [Eubenangee virus]